MEHSSEQKQHKSETSFADPKSGTKPTTGLWKDATLLTHFLLCVHMCLVFLVISPGSRLRWGRHIR